ncbi:S-adenosyl-L-methionine-dependent methyltransferase [Annulohypoxylon bovei var. microspora]|nr:S-adenosyl-L-methionine-dependent methyltransferase [Annulohypoxylon bovei var. microspora]
MRERALQSVSELRNILQQNNEASLSESERVQALQAAKALVNSLEKPADALLILGYTPAVWMAMRICVELNVFSILSENCETSSQELARRTGADEALIKRLVRVLVASGYVAEQGPGLYGSTKWTEQLQTKATQGMVKYIYDIPMPAIAQAPSWFKKTGYQNPTDPKDSLLHYAFDCKGTELFPWLSLPENVHHWDDANTFFEGDKSRPSWVTWFPVREKLISNRSNVGSVNDGEAPLLVDVGGGRGQDITEFEQQFPDISGRLVLQDQRLVLDSAISLSPRVEKYAIDFFNESPVKGARIYFLKFILHDFMDEQCLTILKNIMTSMKRGYSYLVINDFILPDVGCSLLPAQWDLVMMAAMASMERSESQWHALLKAAGLSIEGLYQPPGVGQGIIITTLEQK